MEGELLHWSYKVIGCKTLLCHENDFPGWKCHSNWKALSPVQAWGYSREQALHMSLSTCMFPRVTSLGWDWWILKTESFPSCSIVWFCVGLWDMSQTKLKNSLNPKIRLFGERNYFLNHPCLSFLGGHEFGRTPAWFKCDLGGRARSHHTRRHLYPGVSRGLGLGKEWCSTCLRFADFSDLSLGGSSDTRWEQGPHT